MPLRSPARPSRGPGGCGLTLQRSRYHNSYGLGDIMSITPSPRVERIRVGLLDDHKILSEGLAAMLSREPDIEVVAQCQRVDQALEAAATQSVSLFVVDLQLDGEDGFALLSQLKKADFPGCVVVLAARVLDEDVVRLVRLGVTGIILKNSPPDVLLNCIRSVAAGEVWFDQRHMSALVRGVSGDKLESEALTDREKDVLRALLQGLSNKEIADHLQIRETAVKFFLQNLFRKTGVHTRSQLVRIALEKYRDTLLT